MSTSKKTQIKLSRPLKQTNFLTEARQLFRPSVYRTIKFIVRKIVEDGDNLDSIIENRQTLKVTISMDEIKKWYPNNQYERDVKEAAEWLNKTDIQYETTNGWVITHLIGEASFDRDKGLDVFINPGALPLYHIKENEFTILDFDTSMLITKKSTQFFYDKCCRWRSARKFKYTPDELRKALDLKYENNRLKKRILEPAQEDLKLLFLQGESDLCFDLEEIKAGRGQGGGVVQWIFRIRTSADGDPNSMFEMLDSKKYILEVIKGILPDNLANISIQLELLEKDRYLDLYERIKKLSEREMPSGRIRDIKSYTYKLLRDDFGINPNTKELISRTKINGEKRIILTNIESEKEAEFKQGKLLFEDNLEWEKLISKIKLNVTATDFKDWFSNEAFTFQSLNENILTIKVANQFVYEKMESSFIEVLKTSIAEIYGNVKLMYKIGN